MALNLHKVREIQEGLKDDTEAALINLDQSQAFDRVDHRFLVTVLETAGFQLEFRKWINMYHNTQAVVQVNGNRSEAFAIEQSVWQGCPLSPLLYVGLGMKGLVWPCVESPLSAVLGRKTLRTPTGHTGCEEGSWEVGKNSRCQDQFWKERRSAAGFLERWLSLARVLPQEWRSHLHPRGVVRARSPTGAKIAGCTG